MQSNLKVPAFDDKKKIYFNEINLMRGMLVILVVAGHIFLQTDTVGIIATAYKKLGNIIYSFHMPAFFLISGFLDQSVLTLTGTKGYIKKKFLRLMVPYLTMAVVYLPFRLFMSRLAQNPYSMSDIWKVFIGQNPDGALWFLYALFLIAVLTKFFIRWIGLKRTLIVSLTAYFLISLVHNDWGAIVPSIRNWCFFTTGVMLRINYVKFVDVLSSSWIYLISIFLFSISNCFLDIVVFRYFASISGIALAFKIAYAISQTNVRGGAYNCLNILGLYGMDVYIFSEPIKVILRFLMKQLNPLIVFIPLCIGSILLALLFSKFVVRKNRLLSLLFLGISKTFN